MGSRHAIIAPFGPFTTGDGHVVVGNVKEWDLFCALIGRDDLALDPRFTTNLARVEHVDALEAALHDAFRAKTTDDWVAIIEPADICAIARVNTIADLFDDPHIAARNMLVDLPMPYGLEGTLTLPNSPLRLSGTPTRVAEQMPDHGGQTDAVLQDWLGLDAAELDRLRSAGVVK
jgi:crotonobetainyl-CoA:carnitine CoA-transferase CaiB-like acyl-CoA transferase